MNDFTIQLAKLLGSVRHDVSSESFAQASVETALRSHGYGYVRECRLSAKDRIDFFVGGIGIEIKVGRSWSPMKVYRQLERYAGYSEICSIILLTNKAMKLPPEIAGKPTLMVSVGKAWL